MNSLEIPTNPATCSDAKLPPVPVNLPPIPIYSCHLFRNKSAGGGRGWQHRDYDASEASIVCDNITVSASRNPINTSIGNKRLLKDLAMLLSATKKRRISIDYFNAFRRNKQILMIAFMPSQKVADSANKSNQYPAHRR